MNHPAAGHAPALLKKPLLLKDLLLTWPGLLFTGILLLGLGLRLSGLRFGLPFPFHFDETVYSGAALNLGAGKTGVQINPTGFTNLLFIEYAIYFVAGRLAGAFQDAASFGASYEADPSSFLMLARLTSALAGALTIGVLYWLGRGWKSTQARLLSAFFLAAAFLHVRDSHFGVPDATAAFLVLLSAALCIRSLQAYRKEADPPPARRLPEKSAALLWLAFFSAAYAVMVKWSVWPVFIPALLTLREHWKQTGGRLSAGRVARSTLPCLLAAAAGLLLGGFQILFSPAAYAEYALHEMGAGQSGGFFIWQIDTLPGWLFYLKVLFQGLGIPLAALILIAVPLRLIAAVRSRNRNDLILLAFPVIYFLLMGATRHYFARYILPVIPFAILFAVDGLLWAKTRLQARYPRGGQVIFALATIALLAQPLAASLRLDDLLHTTDTRALAHEWVGANLPDGARVAIDSPFLSVPLSTAEQPLPNSDKVFQVRHFLGESGLSAWKLDWYREQEFDYLIASSFIYNIPLNDPIENQSRQTFYRTLDESLTRVQIFGPVDGDPAADTAFVFDEIYAPLVSLWERDRTGPVLKIYKLP